MRDKREVIKAPYMGQVAIRHRTGDTYLHGSDVVHSHTIVLSISRGKMDRHLNQFWYYGDGAPLIEIEMTPLQYLELITNPNTGCGTPCTIHRIKGEGRIEAPKKPKLEKALAQEELKKDFEQVLSLLDDLDTEIVDLKISQKKKDVLHARTRKIKQEIGPNLMFAYTQFCEATERLLGEAKATAETYLNNVLFRLGLKTAQEAGVSPQELVYDEHRKLGEDSEETLKYPEQCDQCQDRDDCYTPYLDEDGSCRGFNPFSDEEDEQTHCHCGQYPENCECENGGD